MMEAIKNNVTLEMSLSNADNSVKSRRETDGEFNEQILKRRRPWAARAKTPGITKNYDVEDSLRTLKSESVDHGDSLNLRHQLSAFKEAECGEPLEGHRLQLDFTIREGLDDNVDLQNKCVQFWHLLSQQSDLERLKVHPVQRKKEHVCQNYSRAEDWKDDEELENKDLELTAMDWLKREELMSQAFATEERKACEVGSGDYCPGWRAAAGYRRPDEPDMSLDKARMTPNTCVKASPLPDDIDDLMREMDDFDLMHPRSMSPPGPSPSFIKAKIEKHV